MVKVLSLPQSPAATAPSQREPLRAMRGFCFPLFTNLLQFTLIIYIYIVRGYAGKCKDFVWMPRNEAARWNGPLWEGDSPQRGEMSRQRQRGSATK